MSADEIKLDRSKYKTPNSEEEETNHGLFGFLWW